VKNRGGVRKKERGEEKKEERIAILPSIPLTAPKLIACAPHTNHSPSPSRVTFEEAQIWRETARVKNRGE
jgi:hypothetical protein